MENKTIEESHKENQPQNHFEPMGNFLWDLLKVLLLSVLIIIPVRYFLFQPFVVSGSSMEPNYHNGDYLIVDEISYRFKDPARGDVVVLRFPNNGSQFFIKRIIGLPGEKVVIENGKVAIHQNPNGPGSVLGEGSYLSNNTFTPGQLSIILEEDEYFVLGDNRDASSDSRTWGPLEEEYIIGRAWIRLFPLPSFKIFPTPSYNL